MLRHILIKSPALKKVSPVYQNSFQNMKTQFRKQSSSLSLWIQKMKVEEFNFLYRQCRSLRDMGSQSWCPRKRMTARQLAIISLFGPARAALFKPHKYCGTPYAV